MIQLKNRLVLSSVFAFTCCVLMAQAEAAAEESENKMALIVAILIGAVVGGLTSYLYAKRKKK